MALLSFNRNILNNSGSKAWESFEVRERIFEISMLHNFVKINKSYHYRVTDFYIN